jgi:hypothetical protein
LAFCELHWKWPHARTCTPKREGNWVGHLPWDSLKDRIASACNCAYLLATRKFQDYNGQPILFHASRGQKLTTHMNGFSKKWHFFLQGIGFYKISVQIAPAILWIAKTRNLLTFILMVKMVVVSDLFTRKYIPFCKKDNLQTRNH